MKLPGFCWPEGTRESQKEHALAHVRSAELAIGLCKRRRTAIQAGGNVGLWPARFAESFERVLTFEPEPVSRACLAQNVAAFANVTVRAEALGDTPGACGIDRRSLGSHNVVDGASVAIVTIDSLELVDVDLLQLDIEGYELRALRGGAETIRRCRPVIQVELRGFTEKYGDSDAGLIEFLVGLGYREKARVPGSDVVFAHGP